jgi:asparagine synthase (glutamine-hydrolysing)
LSAVLADPGSPVLPLLDTDRVRQLVDAGYEGSMFGAARRGIELVLSLDGWLRRYPVRLEVD